MRIRLLALGILLHLLSQAQVSNSPSFTHQWSNLNGPWNLLDTTLNLNQYHTLNTLMRDDFGSITAGNLGNPRIQLLPNLSQSLLPGLGFGAYHPYFENPSAIRFYQVRSALTEARFLLGYERGQHFSIYHTQNINKRWNFSFHYQRLNSLGKYIRQKATGGDFLATTNYLSAKGTYQAHAYFRSFRRLIQENGGILTDTAFTENTVTDRLLMEVNLANAEQIIRRREAFLSHSLGLFTPQKDSIAYTGLDLGVYNRLHYRRDIRTYSDVDAGFYGTPLISAGSFRDSSRLDAFEAAAGVSLNRVATADRLQGRAGVFWDQRRYAARDFLLLFTHLGFEAELTSARSSSFNWAASTRWLITGPWSGQQLWHAHAGWLRKKYQITAGINLQQGQPELFYQTYSGNYALWINNLSPERKDRIYGVLKLPFLGTVEVSLNRWEQYTYLDSTAAVRQYAEPLAFTRINWESAYTWGVMHLDPRLTYQTGLAELAPLRMPELVTRIALYAQFKLFRKALELQVGTEGQWFTAYYAPGYRPDLAHYVLQDTEKIGGYPWLDFFINAKISHAWAFIKVEHLNAPISGYDYWAMPGYPRTDLILRAGIQWRFFN